MFHYEWCGLGIRSGIELPLAPAQRPFAQALTIEAADVPLALHSPHATFPFFQASPGALLLNIPEVARYLVENGDRVTFEPYAEAELRDIQTFLLGSVLGAVCHQRQLLPLHASAVRVADGCIAFAGVSGAGKSTIAAFLADRGYPLVADDQCVVSVNLDRVPVVAPGPARVKLWRDGLDALSADPAALARVRGRLDKYHLPLPVDHGSDPLPLRKLYLLTDGGSRLALERLGGFDAVEAVARNVYRRQFVAPLGMTENCFRICAAVAASAEVATLTRPRGFDQLAGLLADLEAEWAVKSA